MPTTDVPPDPLKYPKSPFGRVEPQARGALRLNKSNRIRKQVCALARSSPRDPPRIRSFLAKGRVSSYLSLSRLADPGLNDFGRSVGILVDQPR